MLGVFVARSNDIESDIDKETVFMTWLMLIRYEQDHESSKISDYKITNDSVLPIISL